MAYQGNQINYNNLNDELKVKVDKAEGVESQVSALSSKVDNSWQKGVYNDTDIINLGYSSASKVFRFHEWDDDNSKLDSLYIDILVGRAFSGLIKLTLASDYHIGNAMGGTEIVYNVAKVGEDVFLNTMTINNISPDFAKCFYVKPLVSEASRLYIPITKAPNTRNPINIKVEIFSAYATFDVVNEITIARDPMISQPHPWTPQTSSFMARTGGTMTGDLVIEKGIPNLYLRTPNKQHEAIFRLNASNENDFGLDLYRNGSIASRVDKNGYTFVKGLDGDLFNLADLKSSVSNGKAQVASAITGKGVQTASDATFDTMANNIRAIPTGVPKVEFDLQLSSVVPDGSAGNITTPAMNFQPLNASNTMIGTTIFRGMGGDISQSNAINGVAYIEKCTINNIGNGNYTVTFTIRNKTGFGVSLPVGTSLRTTITG